MGASGEKADDNVRRGQKEFNLLHQKHPEIADRIRGSADDPYYDDRRLEAFRRRVEQEKTRERR